MCALADVELVERDETLPVIELRFDHGAPLHVAFTSRSAMDELLSIARCMRNQNSIITLAIWVEAEHQLSREILRRVRDEPVLSERNDDVVGLEDEAIEVLA